MVSKKEEEKKKKTGFTIIDEKGQRDVSEAEFKADLERRRQQDGIISKGQFQGDLTDAETGRTTGVAGPDKTFISGKNILPEEFDKLRQESGITPESKQLFEQKQRSFTDIEQQAQLQREQEQAQPPQIPQEEPSAVIGGELRTESEIQAGLMSGSVQPINSDDLFNLATLGSAGSLFALTTKAAAKQSIKQSSKLLTKGIMGSALAGLRGLGGKVFGAVILGTIISEVGKSFLEGGAQDEQSALNTLGELATTLTENVALSIDTPQEARRNLDQLEKEIIKQGIKSKGNFIQQGFLFLKGQTPDIENDIADALLQVHSSRADIDNIIIREPDTIELALYIEQTRKSFGVKKESFDELLKRVRDL